MGNNKTSTKAEVLEIIKAVPDVLGREVLELMPHATPSQVYCTLNALKRSGVIIESGKKSVSKSDGFTTKAHTYRFVEGTPTPQPRVMKRKVPTAAGYDARITELLEKLHTLEEWKADAIKRHPDLAVPPIVIKARKIVADEVRAGGDTLLASQIMAGNKDTTLMMRVTLKALEEDV